MEEIRLIDIVSHDAFRFGGGLNKSGAIVYWHLCIEPMNAKRLITKTGMSRRTVFRALMRMSKIVDTTTGEIIQMVTKVGKNWHAEQVDLSDVAFIVGTSGKGKAQRKKHIAQRQAHRRSLRVGRRKIND